MIATSSSSSNSSNTYNPELLSRIRIKYVSAFDEVVGLLSVLQDMSVVPSLLLLHNVVSTVAPPPALDKLSMLLALLDDTVTFLQQSSQTTAVCRRRLVLSESCRDPVLVVASMRYVHGHVHMEPTTSPIHWESKRTGPVELVPILQGLRLLDS
jgi:hypothetical protein